MLKGVKSKKFLQQAEHLLAHIVCLNQRKKKKVDPSNNYLAKSIGCSERQVVRYLQHLKEINKLTVNTITLKDVTNTEKPYKRHRTINLASKEIPRHFKELTKIHFSNSTSEEKKEMVANVWFKQYYRTPTVTSQTVYTQPPLEPVLEIKANSPQVEEWIKREQTQPTVKQMKEEQERQRILFEEAQKEENNERNYAKYLHLQNELVNKALKGMSNGKALKATDPFEKMTESAINNFKDAWPSYVSFRDEEPKVIPEKIEYMASTGFYKNKEVYIQILLPGDIPYNIKLFDYVPWEEGDEFHQMFMKELIKIRGLPE